MNKSGAFTRLLGHYTDVLDIVKEGDRVAQLVLEKVSLLHCGFLLSEIWSNKNLQIYTPEVAVVEELEESVRGAGGFGSTGV